VSGPGEDLNGAYIGSRTLKTGVNPFVVSDKKDFGITLLVLAIVLALLFVGFLVWLCYMYRQKHKNKEAEEVLYASINREGEQIVI
jgi:hypothetical protein